MRALVADASALLQLVLVEPEETEIRRLVAARDRAGAPILVPTHFWLELVNVLAHGHGMAGSQVVEAIRELDRVGLETRELGREAALLVLDAVERHRLTAYDAAYLVLAESVDAELLTADRELARAARERAIWIGPGGRIAEAPAPYEVTPTWPSWRGAAAYLVELRQRAAET